MPIHDKMGVLDELRVTLSLCEGVLKHSAKNGEPAEARANITRRAEHLREAIRFIEDYANGAAS